MGDCNYEWLGKTSLRRWQIPKGGKGVHITVCISTGGRLQTVVRIFQILYGVCACYHKQQGQYSWGGANEVISSGNEVRVFMKS